MMASLPQRFAAFFQHWIGWGWTLTALLWVAGALVILGPVQRHFLQRTGSRRLTIVVFVVWSLGVIVLAARWFGFGAPPGG
ncbi:MAG TPA: hypothetical protein VFI08_05590 [Spirochaetia bacterium]|nr:hypothetical protein [Spirochaetia bacterium]